MDEIRDESFVNLYPEIKREIWCANVNCKYNDCKGRCTCENVKLSWGHIHTTNDGVIDYYQCKSFEQQMNTKAPMFLHIARGSGKTIPMSPIPIVMDDEQKGEKE